MLLALFSTAGFDSSFDLAKIEFLISQFDTSIPITLQRMEIYFMSYYFAAGIDLDFAVEWIRQIRLNSNILVQMEQSRLGDSTAVVDINVKSDLEGYQLMIFKFFDTLGLSEEIMLGVTDFLYIFKIDGDMDIMVIFKKQIEMWFNLFTLDFSAISLAFVSVGFLDLIISLQIVQTVLVEFSIDIFILFIEKLTGSDNHFSSGLISESSNNFNLKFH